MHLYSNFRESLEKRPSKSLPTSVLTFFVPKKQEAGIPNLKGDILMLTVHYYKDLNKVTIRDCFQLSDLMGRLQRAPIFTKHLGSSECV